MSCCILDISIPDMKDPSDMALAAAMLNVMSAMLPNTGLVSPDMENWSWEMEPRELDMGRGCSMLGKRPG